MMSSAMLLFLDVETTGFDPEKAELLELAAVRWDGVKITATFDQLICPQAPDFEIPAVVERLTGITPAMVKNQPPLQTVRQEFLENFLQADDIIVGHNISFDTGFLKAKGFVFENAEIDTYPLSTLLLPEEESHSLEILAEKYRLPHENAHRALGDVIANLELWKLLQQKCSRLLSGDLRGQYEKVLAKSSWPGKVFFEACPPEKKENSSQPDLFASESLSARRLLRPEEEKNSGEKNFQEILRTALTQQKKAVWEVAALFPFDPLTLATETAAQFALESGLKIGIAAHSLELEKLRGLQKELREKYPKLRVVEWESPDRVLCFSKWREFLKKEKFNDLETIVALKMWRDLQNGGTRAPNLKRDEWAVWEDLSALHHEHCAADCPGKNFEPAQLLKNYQLFFISHYQLASFPDENLLLLGAEHLDTLLTRYGRQAVASWELRAHAQKFPPEIGGELEFFLDLLGAFVRKVTGESPYLVEVLLDENLQRQREWKEFRVSFEALAAKLAQMPLPPEQKEKLTEVVAGWRTALEGAPRANVVAYLRLFPDDAVEYVEEPVLLDEPFQKLTAGAKAKIAIGSHFPKTAAGEWRFHFTIPTAVEQQKLCFFGADEVQNRLSLLSPVDLAEAQTTPKEMARWLEAALQSNDGNLLANFSAQRTAAEVEDLLAAVCKRKEVVLISHQHGGTGKIQSLLARPGRKVFLGTSGLFEKVLPFAGVHFEFYFFQKFIFDPPGNPLLAARKNLHANGFEDFVLSRSLGRFEREVFRLLENQNAPFCFFCFDPRLTQQKSFGNVFQTVFPAGSHLRQSTLDGLTAALKMSTGK